MLEVQETNFPIVSVQFINAVSLEDVEQYLSHFDQWLTRETPFGLILSQLNDPNKDMIDDETVYQAVHRTIVQWGKQNKAQILQHCAGIALLVEDVEELAQKRRAAPKTITAIYGCPGQACVTALEAQQWISQQLLRCGNS
jgi:cyclopropane fatty-acyl-phospholipid synthase-like methyltransferase